MSDILTTLKANWAVVSNAPYAFLACVAVVTVMIWTAFSFLKANEILALNSRIKLRDDEIENLKNVVAAVQASGANSLEDARQIRRRSLVENGRRFIADFNAQSQHHNLNAYLISQPEWPAVRAHMDKIIIQQLENDRTIVVPSIPMKDGKICYLRDEMDRLEREWDLI